MTVFSRLMNRLISQSGLRIIERHTESRKGGKGKKGRTGRAGRTAERSNNKLTSDLR
jgi:hypothetical protein